MSVKLVSVNIEGKKHIDKIKGLIDKTNPDVICMQEVFEDDVTMFADYIGGEFIFSPMLYKPVEIKDLKKTNWVLFGHVIISKIPFYGEAIKDYYFRSESEIKFHRQGVFIDLAMVLTSVNIKKNHKDFCIATTHFCKSEAGKADAFQLKKLPALMSSLEKIGSFVICGDFNAPRGQEIFDTIASKYKDNIDPKYKVSLDPDIHRAGALPFMVDGLFSTPDYKITNMHFETGVSDHYAIVSEVEKVD